MERNNVLLKITDLRQYFPVGKKKGLYVKANDGISLNIYEGETVGLVGESGCGKSTFGRTLLQLYRQTDGKTMYYGASRDELAPEYIEKTIRHLPHGLHELAALEKKRDEMQKVYDAADEQKRLHMHNDLTAAKKAANDAYLNIVNVIGGFITAKDLGPVMKIFSERHDRCCDLHKAIEKRAPVKLDYDEEAFKLSKLKAGERGYDSRKGKLDKLAEKVAEHDKLVEAARAEIAKVDARIDAMRAKYAADPEFQKHEALLDNGIEGHIASIPLTHFPEDCVGRFTERRFTKAMLVEEVHAKEEPAHRLLLHVRAKRHGELGPQRAAQTPQQLEDSVQQRLARGTEQNGVQRGVQTLFGGCFCQRVDEKPVVGGLGKAKELLKAHLLLPRRGLEEGEEEVEIDGEVAEECGEGHRKGDEDVEVGLALRL